MSVSSPITRLLLMPWQHNLVLKKFCLYSHRGAASVRRYDLPLLPAFNFVIDDVLEGGVNGSLNLDGHGKSNSFILLAMPVQVKGLD